MSIENTISNLFSKISREVRAVGVKADFTMLISLYMLKFTTDYAHELELDIAPKNSFDSLARLYGHTTNDEDIILYIKMIETNLNIKNSTISEYVRNLLSSIPEMDTKQKIFNLLLKASFKESADLPTIANSLVLLMDIFSTKEELFTYNGISELMSELTVTNQAKEIYVQSSSSTQIPYWLTSKNKEVDIYADYTYYPSFVCSQILKIILKASNLSTKSTQSFFSTDKRDDKYDSVTVIPPFGYIFSPEKVKELHILSNVPYPELITSKADLYFAQQAIMLLNTDGIATIILPNGALFQGGKVAEHRKQLLKNGHIQAIIQLPTGCLRHTGIASSILILRQKSDNQEILFVNANSKEVEQCFEKYQRTSNLLTDEGKVFILDIIRNKKELEGISRIVQADEVESKNYILTPEIFTNIQEVEEISYQSIEELMNKENALLKQLIVLNESLNQQLKNL